MQKPKAKPAPEPEKESTTELIAALCEISIETADKPPTRAEIEALERRLVAQVPRK